jgi:hypothetical protein
MIAILAPLVLFALYVALAACLGRAGDGGVALWWKVTAVAAAGRIGVLWILLALHWRGGLGLWATPFLLLLLPEGFLLPRDFAWTVARAVLVTALLAAGTALWAALAVAVLRLLRGAGSRPAPRPGC